MSFLSSVYGWWFCPATEDKSRLWDNTLWTQDVKKIMNAVKKNNLPSYTIECGRSNLCVADIDDPSGAKEFTPDLVRQANFVVRSRWVDQELDLQKRHFYFADPGKTSHSFERKIRNSKGEIVGDLNGSQGTHGHMVIGPGSWRRLPSGELATYELIDAPWMRSDFTFLWGTEELSFEAALNPVPKWVGEKFTKKNADKVWDPNKLFLEEIPSGLEDAALSARRGFFNAFLAKITARIIEARKGERNVICFDEFCKLIRLANSPWCSFDLNEAKRVAFASARELRKHGGRFDDHEILETWLKAFKNVVGSNMTINDPAFEVTEEASND